jgi:hypothetical protein
MSSVISIATITLARTSSEANLLERALERLADGTRRIALTDGGSGDAFLTRVSHLPGITVTTSTHGFGLLAQVKSSLEAALSFGTRFILYTEPDKEQFFESGLAEFIRRAEPQRDAGVIVAARSEASYATFPQLQQYTESVINTLCGEYTRQRGDYSYGPFLIDRRLVPHVLSIREDIGWGWRPFVFALAPRFGLAVTLVGGEHPCPPGQRIEDDAERLHRIAQLQQNLRGLLLSQTIPV